MNTIEEQIANIDTSAEEHRRETRLALLVQIAQGLLASGHFTNGNDNPEVMEYDLGENVVEGCRRCGFYVSEHAYDILLDIEEEMDERETLASRVS